MTNTPAWGHDPEWSIDDPTDEIDDSENQEHAQPAESAARANSHTGPTPPRLFFANLDEFVRDFVRLVFRRGVGETGRAEYRWSARWWESAEAVIRLEAMWRSWEQARLDPTTGISTWLRDHADYHMTVLTSPNGPFAQSKDTANYDEPLPYQAPPADLFPDARTQEPVRTS